MDLVPHHGHPVPTPSPVKGRYITSLLPDSSPALLVHLPLPHCLFPSTPIHRMSFVDDDSLSLAGLDTPNFLQLDNSFSSSLTAHCHSFCTTPTCMGDSGRRNIRGPRPLHIVAAEKVRIDVHVKLSTPTSSPRHRLMAATSSNLFHPSHKSLRSTFQPFGICTLAHPPSPTPTPHPPSSLENPPSVIHRSTPLMVTTLAQASALRRSPIPQRLSTSAPTRTPPGQAHSDDISWHARTAPSRTSVGIPGRNQGVAPELPIPLAVARASWPSDAISQAFAGFVG
jgi:hypothetical protein